MNIEFSDHTDAHRFELRADATLARGALDSARERGLAVVPSCPFVASYITKHPEYADLVAAHG